jgi:chromosomal replication initiator protein
MYLTRELTSLSLEEIGGYFGGRDHTTVLHAARTIRDQRERDSELQATLQELLDRLRHRVV